MTTRSPSLKAAEVAALLGVHVSVIYRLASRGVIGHVRVGRAVRFPKEAVEEFLARAYRPGRVMDGQGVR